MTAEDVSYVLGELGIAEDQIVLGTPMIYVVLQKFETKFPAVDECRFRFDSEDRILFVYMVHETPMTKAELDAAGYEEGKNYDEYEGRNYVYLCDSGKNPLVDSYDYSQIFCIAAA